MKECRLSSVVDLGSLQVVGEHSDVQVSEVHSAREVRRPRSQVLSRLAVVRQDLRPRQVPGLGLLETWEVPPE